MGFLPTDPNHHLHLPCDDDDDCVKCHVEACERNDHRKFSGDENAPKICDLIEKNTYRDHIQAEKYTALSIIYTQNTTCSTCDHWKDNVKPEDHRGMTCNFPEGWDKLDQMEKETKEIATTMRQRLDDRIDHVNQIVRKKHGVSDGERSLVGYDKDPYKPHSPDMRLRFENMGEPLEPRRLKHKEKEEERLEKKILEMKEKGLI